MRKIYYIQKWSVYGENYKMRNIHNNRPFWDKRHKQHETANIWE